MTFREEIIKTIIDKGLLAIIIIFITYKVNQISEVEKNKADLEQEITKSKRQIRIQNLEKQLSVFYWPIYLRLQKDNALWHRIGSLSGTSDTLPREIGNNIERAYIIKNHNEIVDIIDKNIYLSQLSQQELDTLVRYTQHVAIYNAILLQKERKYNPIDLKEPFPKGLFPIIESNLKSLQSEYDELIISQKNEQDK
jgi:hypothetical protein